MCKNFGWDWSSTAPATSMWKTRRASGARVTRGDAQNGSLAVVVTGVVWRVMARQNCATGASAFPQWWVRAISLRFQPKRVVPVVCAPSTGVALLQLLCLDFKER